MSQSVESDFFAAGQHLRRVPLNNTILQLPPSVKVAEPDPDLGANILFDHMIELVATERCPTHNVGEHFHLSRKDLVQYYRLDGKNL